MLNIVKNLGSWIVPHGLYKYFKVWQLGVNSPRLSKSEKSIVAKNAVLKNRHMGERCFILATGPSIRTQDLQRLEGEHCIAVSNFAVHPAFERIKPEYYCFAPWHPPIREEDWRFWMEDMESRIPEKTTLFFGLSDHSRIERYQLFRQREIQYLLFGGSSPLCREAFDLTQTIPGPASVPVMALLIALYMGFSSIYLLGCDHDWMLHYGKSVHFYNEQEHALNRRKCNEWNGVTVYATLQSMVRLWNQYIMIDGIAKQQGAQIYNATGGGMLDVFPLASLDDVLTSCCSSASSN